MKEIKKISDGDMKKVSGGGYGDCHRCNRFRHLSPSCQLYGNSYCEECFKIVDKLDRNGGSNNDEILKELKALREEIAELRKKIK